MANPRRDDVAPVSIDVPHGQINGFAAPAFQSVAKAFVENFERREEVGAAVCVLRDRAMHLKFTFLYRPFAMRLALGLEPCYLNEVK